MYKLKQSSPYTYSLHLHSYIEHQQPCSKSWAPKLGVTRWLNHLKDFQTTFDHLKELIFRIFHIFFFKNLQNFSTYFFLNFFENINILAIFRLTTSSSKIPPRGPPLKKKKKKKKSFNFTKKFRCLKIFL